MEPYETMLKFLDKAITATVNHAASLPKLDEKVIYHRHAGKLRDARQTLLKEHYAFEDFMSTGEYIVPKISCTTVEVPVEALSHTKQA